MSISVAEMLSMIVSLTAGAVLGLIFFGGLRWTVGRGLSSKHAALWFAGSLILRMTIVLLGFYWVSDLHFDHLSVCLLGFVTAQLTIIFLTAASVRSSASRTREASHAPLS